MSLIDRLKGAATGLGSQLKTAAKEQARALMLPNLIAAKSVEIMQIDNKLNKLGWSPESKHERMQLTAMKTQLAAEVADLSAEHDRNLKAAKAAQKERLKFF